MKKLWTLMLVLLPLTMWGQEGYWELYDKKIYKGEHDGKYFPGVTMDGTYGRFSMKSVQEDKDVYSMDHSHCCKGEWLYIVSTYTEPRKYYKSGEMLESTYQTKTAYSSPCDGVPFPDGASIDCYIYTGYDKERNICVNISCHAKNENGKSGGAPIHSGNHYKDITEMVTAKIPQGSRNSIITVVFGFAHGRGEDGIVVTYYYKWMEGTMPLEEELFTTEEMMEQIEDEKEGEGEKEGPGTWIWIPIAIGIGTTIGGGCVYVYWIRKRRKGRTPKIELTDKDKKDIRKLAEDYREAKTTEGEEAMKWDKLKATGEWGSWFLDIVGDVSTAMLANTAGAAGTPVMGKGMQTGAAALKTFLKGMATDYANDKDLLSFDTIGQNLTKAGADAAKTFLTCGTVGNAPSAAMVESLGAKMGLNIGVDTTTTFITDLWEGKSLGETGKDVVITVFKSAANTGLGELIGKVKWTNMQLNNETWKLEKVINTATNATTDATANAVTNAVVDAGADAANRIIIEKVGNPAAEKTATTIAEGGIDWISQKVEDWFGGKK